MDINFITDCAACASHCYKSVTSMRSFSFKNTAMNLSSIIINSIITSNKSVDLTEGNPKLDPLIC